MNTTARALGMTATRYTDPSGLATSTVSSAADQVILGTATMHQPTLAVIAAMRSAVIPVAGLVRNLNTLLGQNGIAGLKTGSDSAAGGWSAQPVTTGLLPEAGCCWRDHRRWYQLPGSRCVAAPARTGRSQSPRKYGST